MNIVGFWVMIVDSADEVPVEDGEIVVGSVVEVDQLQGAGKGGGHQKVTSIGLRWAENYLFGSEAVLIDGFGSEAKWINDCFVSGKQFVIGQVNVYCGIVFQFTGNYAFCDWYWENLCTDSGEEIFFVFPKMPHDHSAFLAARVKIVLVNKKSIDLMNMPFILGCQFLAVPFMDQVILESVDFSLDISYNQIIAVSGARCNGTWMWINELFWVDFMIDCYGSSVGLCGADQILLWSKQYYLRLFNWLGLFGIAR